MKSTIRFASKGLLAITLSLALIVSGCTFASAIKKFKQYVPIGLQAFAGVVAIVNPAAGSALALAVPLVNKGWSDLNAVIDAYNAADAGTKSSKLADVLNALDAVEQNLNKTVADLGGNPSSPELQAAQASILLLTTTLSAIEAQIAPTAPAPVATAHAHASLMRGPRTVTVASDSIIISAAKSPSEFKAQYNRIMKSCGHPERKLS